MVGSGRPAVLQRLKLLQRRVVAGVLLVSLCPRTVGGGSGERAGRVETPRTARHPDQDPLIEVKRGKKESQEKKAGLNFVFGGCGPRTIGRVSPLNRVHYPLQDTMGRQTTKKLHLSTYLSSHRTCLTGDTTSPLHIVTASALLSGLPPLYQL